MAKLDKFQIKITTGDKALEEPVRMKFNNHVFELENTSGSTETGAVFEGEFQPRSFVHGFTLLGPENGQWAVDKIEMIYEIEQDKVQVAFGQVLLDDSNEVNVWKEKEPEVFDV